MILESARKLARTISRFKLNVIAQRINNSSPFSQLKKAEQVDSFLTSFSQGKTARFMFDSDDIAFFRKAFPDVREGIIRDADDICNHYFNLLGSGRKKVDDGKGNLRWHFDFKVGKGWDADAFCLDLLQLRDDDADILVPWELSRFPAPAHPG